VGRILLEKLAARRFPVGKLLPFSSGRRRARIPFQGRSLAVPAVDLASLRGSDLVFLASSDEVAARYGKDLARRGIWVIDDSSRFRLDPAVPLAIPLVNPGALRSDARLIAGPNCTTAGLAVAAQAIHRTAKARRVRIASYQAVSGAGRDALLEFYSQTRAGARVLGGQKLLPDLPARPARAFPKPIAFNLFPQIGRFDPLGDSGEESKVRAELRRLWEAPRLAVSTTAVRVPVIRGHSLAVWIETAETLSPKKAAALLRRTPGVRLWPEGRYPTVEDAAGTDPVHVGRIRRGGLGRRELALWVVSDNLLIGAALNSVHIAEHLLEKGWLRPRA